MSLYLAVELSNESKKLLNVKQTILKQNADGDWEDPTRFHITVRFLSEECTEPDLAIKALKLYEERYKPTKFQVQAKDFHKFDQGVMWIGVDNSFSLYEAKYAIDECLKEVGYPMHKDKFPQYTPHITMGYDVKERDTLDWKFDGIPITVDNISLWNGFKVNGEYIHNKTYGVNLK